MADHAMPVELVLVDCTLGLGTITRVEMAASRLVVTFGVDVEELIQGDSPPTLGRVDPTHLVALAHWTVSSVSTSCRVSGRATTHRHRRSVAGRIPTNHQSLPGVIRLTLLEAKRMNSGALSTHGGWKWRRDRSRRT
jgi:hypothetical protein